MRCLQTTLAVLIFLGGAVSVVEANNLIRVRQGEFRKLGVFPMWGADLGPWTSLPTDVLELQSRLQPLAAHGANTVILRLDAPGDEKRFFNASGELAETRVARRFGELARDIRDHYMACVVSVFSADRRHWLVSREAYERAGENLARTLLSRYSMIFYLGDLDRDGPWPDEAPCALDDPQVLAGMARKIVAVRKDAILAVPARLVPGDGGKNLFYASTDPEALLKWMTANTPDHGLTPESTNTVIVPRVRIHLCDRPITTGQAAMPCPQQARAFLDQVEARRLAENIPGMPEDAAGGASLSDAELDEGFEVIFNGRDLSGWTTLTSTWGAWTVEDGTIHCRGISGPWLMTRKRYDSFVLRLEFKIEEGGNSGVFLRASLDGRCSRFGMEMQIRGISFDPTDRDATGAIYDVRAPIVDAARPAGRWNEAEITCRGDQVIIRLNGRVVQDFNMNDEPKLKDRLRRGVIGLQDHNDKVWFRNLRIKELTTPKASKESDR